MVWQEKEFEERMAKYIDKIYSKLFSGLQEVNRSNRDKIEDQKDQRINFLDRELGIDTLLYFYNGAILTFQEKSRTFSYLTKYDDFTFEFYNDPKTKEPGEWFKLASQLYFYGYANAEENGYEKYYILNVPLLRCFLNSKNQEWIKKHTKFNRPPAKANFIWIPFNEIPKDCIYYSFSNLIEKPIERIKIMGEFF